MLFLRGNSVQVYKINKQKKSCCREATEEDRLKSPICKYINLIKLRTMKKRSSSAID